MPRPKHMRIPPLLFLFTSQVLSIDLTEVVPTLTSFGSLAPFTPPADCFSRSIWSTSRFYDNANPASTFVSRFFTRWYIGCNIDKETGEYNTCCPPQYNTWGFYAPGVCPGGYTTVPNNAANPWVGDQRGTVCCPPIRSPTGRTLTAAGFVTTFVNPLDRAPISISCFEWDDDITTSGKLFQANYNARAIIVFGEQLTSVTFQFLELTGGATTPRQTTPASSSSAESTSEPEPNPPITSEDTSSDPSPGSTTPAGPRQTETESTASSTLSTSSEAPTSTSSANDQGGGGKRGLSGGAIAGIVIGVAIPVLAAVAFFAYRLGRNRQDVPIVPIHNDPSTKEMGYGGNQIQSPWR